MRSAGLFFLSGRPSLIRAASPVDGDVHDWAFPLIERTDRGVSKVVAYWRGTDAARFVQANAERLKAGQALRIEVDRIRVEKNELAATVLDCALAPDRWPRPKDCSTPHNAVACSSPNV
ncbi:MAG: hypothetical protein EOO27_13820 [Comamonadaceae bacterium]|nr:MAG: hypothetical protein EOO27_13820 [Comamonadaceae bacterium]